MIQKTISVVATCVATLALTLNIQAQGELFLGDPTVPSPTDSIAPLSFHGDYLDMSGGYEVGDTVADFQVYDVNGESLKLSDLFAGEKYIVISSGSASCVRFASCFNEEANAVEYQETLDFMLQTRDELEWLFIYGPEAHPGDLENCTSNCPAVTIPAPNGDTLYQHKIYQDRLDAVQLWMDIAEEDTLSYIWDWPMYLDNPSNLVYDNFFARPFGLVVLDCKGVVVGRGDWTSQFLATFGGIEEIEALMEEDFQQCGYAPICNEDDLDTDGDGYCDALEVFMGTDHDNMCDPDNTDSDGDGFCDNHENYAGSDPNDACSPIVSEACNLCPDGATDSDADGICDALELEEGSNPTDPCDPNSFDADSDGICDVVEIQNGSDENNPCSPNGDDTDGDGICDVVEVLDGTDPENACDPNDEDFDQDGYCDTEEIVMGSDPDDPCDPDNTDTDNDGTCDNQEIIDGTDPLVDENATFVADVYIDVLTIFPNPTDNVFTVQSSSTIEKMAMYDLTGNLVLSGPLGTSQQVDISSLAEGVYIFAATSANGQTLISRITKK